MKLIRLNNGKGQEVWTWLDNVKFATLAQIVISEGFCGQKLVNYSLLINEMEGFYNHSHPCIRTASHNGALKGTLRFHKEIFIERVSFPSFSDDMFRSPYRVEGLMQYTEEILHLPEHHLHKLSLLPFQDNSLLCSCLITWILAKKRENVLERGGEHLY